MTGPRARTRAESELLYNLHLASDWLLSSCDFIINARGAAPGGDSECRNHTHGFDYKMVPVRYRWNAASGGWSRGCSVSCHKRHSVNLIIQVYAIPSGDRQCDD